MPIHSEHAARSGKRRQQMTVFRVTIGREHVLLSKRSEQERIPAFREFAAATINRRVLIEGRGEPLHGTDLNRVLIAAAVAQPSLERIGGHDTSPDHAPSTRDDVNRPSPQVKAMITIGKDAQTRASRGG